MKILAIDPGLAMGFAHGDSRGRPVCGVLKLPGFSDAKAAKSFGSAYSAVQGMIRANGIEGVVLEAPLIGIQRENSRGIRTPTNSHGVQMHHMLSGAIQAAIINSGAKLLGMPMPNVWRKGVLGNGFPDDPKGAAVRYCRLALQLTVESHDAAEAVCLFSWGCGQAKLL